MTGCGNGERDISGLQTKQSRENSGNRKPEATAQWDWETSHRGVVNHGPTRGSLTTGSRENALDMETAVRCPQG